MPAAAQVILKPAGRDWYLVDWRDVWARLQLSPAFVPGAQMQDDGIHYRVHLTHLAQLGYEVPLIKPVGASPILRPHQVEGVAYIRSRRGTLEADEMRVGKTATVMFAHMPDTGCLFVVGPLAARAVWHEWAARRFGWCGVGECSICARVKAAAHEAVSFMALSGRKLDDDQLRAALLARVVFCHFAVLPTWRELFTQLKIGTLVVDEIHLPQAGMQNRKSVTSESIRWMNTVAPKAVFTSGSPLWNKPKGLWPILDILTPGAFGPYWDFCRRYADAKPTAYGWQANGSSNDAELRVRLREVMIRRCWKDIAQNLPPIVRSMEVVALDESTRDKVEATAARIRSMGGNTQTVVGDLARLRKMYAHEKVSAAIIKAREAVDAGHSLVLWVWHREVAEQLMRTLNDGLGNAVPVPTSLIHGDIAPDDREKLIEQLRVTSASRPVCLVATMGALATAVSLSFCDTEIFVELDWNPDSIAQAEMRPYDGTRPINCTFLVADCDVEQKLADALLSKLEIKDRLGVAPGVGSVAEVLRTTLGIENSRTLSALADAVMAEYAEG